MTCRCPMKKHTDLFPICGKAFDPNHPNKDHKGKACAQNMQTDGVMVLCGHEIQCHSEGQEPKS